MSLSSGACCERPHPYDRLRGCSLRAWALALVVHSWLAACACHSIMSHGDEHVPPVNVFCRTVSEMA